MDNELNRLKILVVDDDLATLELMKFQLEDSGFEVSVAENGKGALESVAREEFDLILTDLNLPDIDGLKIVRNFKNLSPDTEIIMITAFGSLEMAIEATKAGAFYYVEKPINFGELLLLIEKAIDRKNQIREIRELRNRLTNEIRFEGIIGISRQMRELYKLIDSVADSDANILIVGESGTGKEVVANAIHGRSLRSQKPFIKVNCSALPKELIESQLFGHVKGAFTGAISDRTGFIGQADGGSLLLDEIGEMPVELQPKLLRVLQEKAYHRIGSSQSNKVDFRLICATNRTLADALSQGILREDLYYRINTIEIHIAPLRERTDDIPVLAEHFLGIYSDKYRPGTRMRLSPKAFDSLMKCPWKGNVRELQHVIERAVLLSRGDLIEKFDFPSVKTAENPSPQEKSVSNPAALGEPHRSDYLYGGIEGMDEICERIVRSLANGELKIESDVVDQIEARIVNIALRRTQGNKQAAAKLLGMYRPRLYGIIKRHGIE